VQDSIIFFVEIDPTQAGPEDVLEFLSPLTLLSCHATSNGKWFDESASRLALSAKLPFTREVLFDDTPSTLVITGESTGRTFTELDGYLASKNWIEFYEFCPPSWIPPSVDTTDLH